MHLDDVMPVYHAREYHEIDVIAVPERVYASMRTSDFFDSPLTRWLFALRGLLGRLVGSGKRKRPVFNIDAFLRSGFVLLAEEPPDGILLGMAERLRNGAGSKARPDASGFAAFAEPGYAKYAWSITLTGRPDGTTRLSTETRVFCNDSATRRLFLLSWFFIRPFSGLTRIAFLRTIKREAERV